MNELPPIVLTLDLAIAPARAFDAFTGRFADWWPVATHSLSRSAATRCSFDARAGGRVEEFGPGGACHLWGEVLAIEPGRRVRFTWHPGRDPESAQWVDVDFSPGPSGSRVTLTHGGWEALGEIGPLLRQEYVPGWRHVLGELFAAFAVRAAQLN
ncbi:MAG TPA: SRPBCC domain-containing protein [Steroidobacteraceae bacterium]|nr:SRPBCC domain-containing protein [Steroidobacteraceae bacterium]